MYQICTAQPTYQGMHNVHWIQSDDLAVLQQLTWAIAVDSSYLLVPPAKQHQKLLRSHHLHVTAVNFDDSNLDNRFLPYCQLARTLHCWLSIFYTCPATQTGNPPGGTLPTTLLQIIKQYHRSCINMLVSLKMIPNNLSHCRHSS